MAKVLIIDDSSFTRNRLRNAVENAGHQVTEAATPHTGMQLARQLQPDLITLDLLMPEMTGQEVLQVLKPELPNVRFVVISADVQDFTRQEVMQAGADAFIGKPFKPEEVQTTIARLLAGAQPAADPVPRAGPQVLIVDDSGFARSKLRHILESGGYQVAEADSPQTGVQLALQLQPNLITLDLLMPGMTGQEVLQTLKPQMPNTRFIVITADVQEITRQEVLAAGADAFLGKPYKSDEVLAAAAGLLRAAA